MPRSHRLLWLLPFALAGFFAPAVRADLDNKIQIEARGPVHEAFAQPWEKDPAANELVPQEPPQPVAEEPPSEKPAGANVQWVPGYWQWDEDKKDFLWVSGFWRDVPEGRRWVAGYWSQAASGWQWVGGHWAAEAEQDQQFVPTPPANLDVGPNTPAPDADSFYIPGNWFYTDVGYRWRPGYWADVRADYLWVPARYYWSPRGYLFSSGYWDYGFGRRGLLFPPVYFGGRAFLTAGFVYRPAFAVGFGGLYGSLFVRAGFGHYYFGDYYGRSYLSRGFQPWSSFGARQYDPLFAHERWANRGNPNCLANLNATHLGRANGTLPTPPRTLSAQAQLGANSRTPTMVNNFNQVRQSGTKLEPVSAQQRSAQVQRSQQIVNRSLEQSRTTQAHVAAHGPTTSFKPPSSSVANSIPSRGSPAGFSHSATTVPRYSSLPASHQTFVAPRTSVPHYAQSTGGTHFGGTSARPSYSMPSHGSFGNSFHGGGAGGSFHGSTGGNSGHGGRR